jgi:hypothetical protein
MASSSELPPNVFTQSTSPTKAGTGVSSVVPPELSSLPQEAIKKINRKDKIKLKKDFIAKGFQILYNNKRESFTTHAYGLFYN